jgi:8-oxo-dGTP pyrophosphatase MutT (NUDIX family)
VLVPVFLDATGAHRLIFIQRPAGPAEHAGQVSFPGGRHDPVRDESLVATALREASEEIGLAAHDMRLLGALPERRTFTTGRLVTPFVAIVPAVLELRADPREVEEIFTASLDDFSRRESMSWQHEGRAYEVPCVRVGERVVWGLTLDIVDDLIADAARLLAS